MDVEEYSDYVRRRAEDPHVGRKTVWNELNELNELSELNELNPLNPLNDLTYLRVANLQVSSVL